MNLDALGNTRYVVMELPLGVLPLGVAIREGEQYALGAFDKDGVIRLKKVGFKSAVSVLREIRTLGDTRYVVMELPLKLDVKEGEQYALCAFDKDGVIRVKDVGFGSAAQVLREIETRKQADAQAAGPQGDTASN